MSIINAIKLALSPYNSSVYSYSSIALLSISRDQVYLISFASTIPSGSSHLILYYDVTSTSSDLYNYLYCSNSPFIYSYTHCSIELNSDSNSYLNKPINYYSNKLTN